jgi:predicted MFS family arabinose efflux permease
MVLNSSLLNLGAAGGAVVGGLLITVGGYEAFGIGLPVVAMVATVLAWWPAGVTRSMRGAADPDDG